MKNVIISGQKSKRKIQQEEKIKESSNIYKGQLEKDGHKCIKKLNTFQYIELCNMKVCNNK
jgi:hypothetical protein